MLGLLGIMWGLDTIDARIIRIMWGLDTIDARV